MGNKFTHKKCKNSHRKFQKFSKEPKKINVKIKCNQPLVKLDFLSNSPFIAFEDKNQYVFVLSDMKTGKYFAQTQLMGHKFTHKKCKNSQMKLKILKGKNKCENKM